MGELGSRTKYHTKLSPQRDYCVILRELLGQKKTNYILTVCNLKRKTAKDREDLHTKFYNTVRIPKMDKQKTK